MRYVNSISFMALSYELLPSKMNEKGNNIKTLVTKKKKPEMVFINFYKGRVNMSLTPSLNLFLSFATVHSSSISNFNDLPLKNKNPINSS